ncbi:hypothetical protein J3A83DRAFT_1615107 [Scleroderma citrinum]
MFIDFVALLNQLRHGTLSPEACRIFKSLSRPLLPPPPSMPNITPTELFPTRREVSNSNMTRLKALPHALHIFHSHDTFPNAPDSSTIPKRHSAAMSNTDMNEPPPKPTSLVSRNNKRDGLLSGILAEKELQLKKGAQVMLVKNVDEMLVNGCVGRVVGFYGYHEVMALQGESEKRAGPTKTTGFVRNVTVEADSALTGIKDGSVNKENVDEAVGEMKDSKKGQKSLGSQRAEERFPLVEFPTPEGGKEAVLVMREEFRVEDSEGRLLARRMQVCLFDMYMPG